MPTLNDKLIKSLPIPKGKHKIYWDDKVTGLGIRITNNSALSFILDYVVNGRRRRYTIGRYPALSTTAARDMATELKGKVIRGEDPLEDRRAACDAPTLKEFSSEFLKAKESSLRQSTLFSYKERYLGKHILPKFGNHRISSINKRDIERFHASFAETPMIGNRLLELLRVMFNVAISWGITDDNPARGVKRFVEHKRERYLSNGEINSLIKALNEEENQLNTYAIKLILLTGSRKSEVLSARWQDFDLENNMWVKPSYLTKQNKTSHIPLNSEALEIVRKMKKNITPSETIGNYNDNQIISTEEHLFYNLKTKTHLKDIKKFWEKICKKAEIKNARIHDLRHTFASILVSSGISLEVIGKLIGHSSITTTQRYSHLANSSLKQATDMLASKIMKKD